MTRLNTIDQIKVKKIRVGRGIGSGKGKTSGRGHKGQKSRSGVAIKSFEGGQMPLYRRLPKRGFNPIKKIKVGTINLGKIQLFIEQKKINKSEKISLDLLKKLKIINKNSIKLKILGFGEVKEKIIIEADLFSKSAKIKLEKIGGTFQLSKSNRLTMSVSPQSNDLRNRIVFTIIILTIYRLGTFVPLPGIDPQQLQILNGRKSKRTFRHV